MGILIGFLLGLLGMVAKSPSVGSGWPSIISFTLWDAAVMFE